MELPLSSAVTEHLDVVAETGSTNADLVARASATAVPDFSVLATTSQTAGRGRLGRTWVAPPGATIAVSVFLKPTDAALARIGWLPLMAGLAMTRAVGSLLPAHDVTLKWPNDVLVAERKISGLLGEVVPGGGIVIGAGLNLVMTEDELPVPTATSLVLEGADPADLVDRALSAYLGELKGLWSEFDRGLHHAVTAACGTLGREVRVELPGGVELLGVATGIDDDGRLVVRDDAGAEHVVAAGDVTHLRHR